MHFHFSLNIMLQLPLPMPLVTTHLGSQLRSKQASFVGFMNIPSPISMVKMIFDMMPKRVDKLPEACCVL